MTDNIDMVLNFPDKQKSLTFKGDVTHIQFDETKTGGRLQLFIENVANFDDYQNKPSEEDIALIPDTRWRALVFGKDNKFHNLGTIFVWKNEVKEELEKALEESYSIRGHMPYNIALRRAQKMFKDQLVIVEEIL